MGAVVLTGAVLGLTPSVWAVATMSLSPTATNVTAGSAFDLQLSLSSNIAGGLTSWQVALNPLPAGIFDDFQLSGADTNGFTLSAFWINGDGTTSKTGFTNGPPTGQNINYESDHFGSGLPVTGDGLLASLHFVTSPSITPGTYTISIGTNNINNSFVDSAFNETPMAFGNFSTLVTIPGPVIPEPSAMVLLGMGGLGLLMRRRHA